MKQAGSDSMRLSIFQIIQVCFGMDVDIIFFGVIIEMSGVILFVMTIDGSMVRLCWKWVLGLVMVIKAARTLTHSEL